MQTLHFILVAYGMTFIIIHGKIFEDIRPSKDYTKKWNTLWHCPLCMGFWVGVFLWLTNDLTTLFTFDYSIVTGLFLGCVGSVVSYLVDAVFDDHGIKMDHG